jgi:hypothetical protein
LLYNASINWIGVALAVLKEQAISALSAVSVAICLKAAIWMRVVIVIGVFAQVILIESISEFASEAHPTLRMCRASFDIGQWSTFRVD